MPDPLNAFILILLNFFYCIEDVAFSTHTDGGILKYSTPTLMDLHQMPYEAFTQFESITYDVGLYDFDDMT